MKRKRHTRFAAPPDVLYWCNRSPEHGDCVVAALALACGCSYEVALATSVEVVGPECLKVGINWPDALKIVERLGCTGERIRTRQVDLEEGTGILHVYTPGRLTATSHAVYLWEGRIVEPKSDRQQLWLNAKDFLTHYKYRAGSMIAVRAKEDE